MKIFFLFVLFIAEFSFGQGRETIIIRNISIIDPLEERIYTKSIKIVDGLISAIDDYNRLKRTSETKVIDGQNKYLMAGLSDMHIHLPATSSVDTFLLLNVIAGITTLREMNSKEDPFKVKSRIKKERLISPRIYYSYPEYSNVNFSVYSADSLFRNVKESGYDFVKVFRIFDDTSFRNLMKAAKKYNVIVCGHYPNKNIFLEDILKSGYRSIEHLGGYDRLNQSQIPSAIDLTIKDSVFNCPTLDFDYTYYHLQPMNDLKARIGGIFYASKYFNIMWKNSFQTYTGNNDSTITRMKLAGQPLYERKLTMIKYLNDANALFLVGSDLNLDFQLPGFDLYEEMKRLSSAGISNYKILKAATYNAALFFHEQDLWGNINLGKRADMIILGKNPVEEIDNIDSVETIFMNGKIYYAKELKKMYFQHKSVKM